ncbi:hypothetical protein CTATCC11996_03732 [Comamonas testosteroni ATCC 11996]|nr:hypothetical protein CTATCC11996_03732 [Comamonas testosteroni ATCC 11996]
MGNLNLCKLRLGVVYAVAPALTFSWMATIRLLQACISWETFFLTIKINWLAHSYMKAEACLAG